MGTPDANVPGDQGGRIVGLASVANINRLIAYLETLELVGGDHDGKPMVVLPWERRFIRGAFRTPDGDAALSIAHGNGKTQLVSALACASVDPAGPLHVRGGEVLCVGAAFAQGKLIYDDVLKLLGQRYDLNDRKVWRKQDSANNATLEHRETYAKVSCVGGDPALVHGSRARLLLLDEPAQWKPAKAERMVAALEHGLGKSAGSKLVALGTRPVGDGHFFAKMLKTADYAQSHQTGADDPLFQLRTIRKANPSWDHLPSLRSKVMRLMALAKLDETKEASFRALRLNQGTADTYEAVMFDLATWRGVEGEAERVGPYVLAVDTGTNAAMTACAAYFAATGALAVFAVFPSVPSLGRAWTARSSGGALLRSGGGGRTDAVRQPHVRPGRDAARGEAALGRAFRRGCGRVAQSRTARCARCQRHTESRRALRGTAQRAARWNAGLAGVPAGRA